MNIVTQFFLQMLFSFIATVGYAILINNPKRALLYCGISGTVGWLVYWSLHTIGTGKVFSNFFGAFMAAMTGIIFARIKKMPAILFNIPALVPLVPGATAYQGIRTMVLGNINSALKTLVVVALVTGAIAMGYMVAQLVSDTYTKIKRYKNKINKNYN